MAVQDDAPLIRTVDLKQHFPIRKGLLGRTGDVVRAIDGVSLEIARGEVLGLVGESGSGKSTLGRAMMALQHPTEGSVIFDGADLARLSPSALRPCSATSTSAVVSSEGRSSTRAFTSPAASARRPWRGT